MPTWDDAQYLKFGDARTRAARELLQRVPVGVAERVVDLGCGPGNSTALLRERWPNAKLVGVDTSREMLNKARATLPGVEWLEGDASTYVPEGPVDVLFANALFQWVPHHSDVLPRLFEHVRPGGAFAFQMPNNFTEPTHRLMRELPGPWARKLEAVEERPQVRSPGFYYDLFAKHATSIDIWETRYDQVMADAHAIVEWVKGTGLRPYLEALSPDEREPFLAAYERAVAQHYPERADGKRLFPFPRFFVVAVR